MANVKIMIFFILYFMVYHPCQLLLDGIPAGFFIALFAHE
ncbi:protein of unknown function [Ruminococcaceae bacterium BL-4]|nr:protein of unknown function [Ruminococcaceae bacterium BL-4]